MGVDMPENTEPKNQIYKNPELRNRERKIRNLVFHVLQNGSEDEIELLRSLSVDPEVQEADREVIIRGIDMFNPYSGTLDYSFLYSGRGTNRHNQPKPSLDLLDTSTLLNKHKK